jgi:carbon-monoxide dehydrogenase medium subunit
MYPSSFDYRAPTSLEEVLEILRDEGEDARVLAGGQSLIPMMKLRLADPGLLVDINGVSGLDGIATDNGHLRFGALVRHNDVVRSDLVAEHNSTMAHAAPWIADPLVRNRGTLCGSVAHCDPEGDWNSVMLALGATVVAQRAGGQRREIAIGDFIDGLFTNTLDEGEMVTEVRVPRQGTGAGGTYLKLERKIGDYATAAVATHLRLGNDGTITEAGIGLTAVGPINLKATEAEQLLVGNAPSEELFADAAEATVRACEPHDDVRGPAEWKRQVVRVFTRRGLEQAAAIARGEEVGQ